MLSEEIFKEFSSNTAESQVMVRLAWPSLSTESKLQLINALQSRSLYTPSWLADLAGSDPTPIVQFYSMRLPKAKSKRQLGAEEFPKLPYDDRC